MVGGRQPRSVDMRILLALTCLALAGPLAAQTYAIRAGPLMDPARDAGVMRVHDAGIAGDGARVDVRRAICAGWYPGPSVVTWGKIIAPFGGQSRGIPPEQGALWKYEYLDADGAPELGKAVRANL